MGGLMLGWQLGFRLRSEIFCVAGHAVFVRSAMDLDRLAEVAMRRWRGRLPVDGRGVPGIIRGDLLSVTHAPEKINDERNLGQAEEPGANGNVFVQAENLRGQPHLVD